MDALRLIKTARHAMAEARDVPDVLLEAWQAGLLTEAVGSRLAERGDGEVAALGQLLSEAGAQVASCLEPSPESAAAVDFGGSGRASRLTDLGVLDPLLEELARLLHDTTETLVVLACGADAESLYWTCIDGVDAGSECKDLVAELHRAVRRAEPAGEEDRGTGAGARRGREPALGERIDARARRRSGERAGGRAVEPPDDLTAEGAGDRTTDPLDTVCSAASGRAGARGRPDRPRQRAGALGPARGSKPTCGARAGGGPSDGGASGGGAPVLVVPLSPPSGARGYRAPAEPEAAAGSACSAAAAGRAPEDCRAAPMPARSAFTDASSSCICSSRLFGVAGAAGALGSCGAAGASDQCSDMRGPLRIGGVL
ncbi:hypothetical protein GCM10010495_18920 [Kitasatospora herbaricolor]|uniref:DUF6099 family protein n=1 Tax=Kitasatospora herbaricolor TaxID=68217 RepID=UPI00174E7688|nr:DUF6099 family protein [Kitasatospora herbaricolor]MDQ0308338.1 hypothetical protein [Kitasatospora herbaricolor]GGV06796.1 hypothetical protein GCM10010495_18920 [Kitasatospora herbaricolor]